MSNPNPPVEINSLLDRMPFGPFTGLRSHSCSATASTMTFAPGGYVLFLAGSTNGVASFAGTAVAPTVDSAEVVGAFILPAGVPVTVSVGGDSTLNLSVLLLASATSILYAMRVL